MPGKYIINIKEFLNTENETIIGHLSLGINNHKLLKQQRTSWNNQISHMKDIFKNLDGKWIIILEYPIPRRSKRVDIILIANDVIYVIEYKDKEIRYNQDAIRQVEDYALDIRDFHKESDSRTIVPIVWASDGGNKDNSYVLETDFVKNTLFSNNVNLYATIKTSFEYFTNTNNPFIDSEKWNNSEYLPTPTIVEAAQHLFAGQNVRDISHSHAGSENLTETTNSILNAIKTAQEENKKIIYFITGVPGAGKTLAGLNIVHNTENNSGKGTFLSGNGPLVKVLTEALARDHSKRTNQPIGESRRKIAFVQNVHQFLDFYHNKS